MDIGNCFDVRSTNRSQVKSFLFGLSFLCSWIVLYSPCVYPAVTPDGATAATVTTTINGVPIVGIVAPTSGGVSHNTFTTFDVGSGGVIINNSLNGGTSALSGVGAVGANGNFTGTSASIILNEVTSTNRSSLLGITEILGDDASYILANPNGITCNGCGFIRTPTAVGDMGNLREVILSTSDAFTLFGPNLDLNDLSIAVNSPADIIIGPGGLDVSNVNVTTLFTRTLNVTGLINAANNRLQILLGTGTLAFDAAFPEDRTYTSTQSTDGTVTVAIDASVAGAMNAGQIYIMVTEGGVGVTLDNNLIASAGNVELTANGDIVYRNVNASDTFNVTTNGIGSTLTVNGTTAASNDINWDLAGNADINTGAAISIDAGNTITVNCTSGNCDINSQDSLTLNAVQVNGNANIITTAGNDLVVNANLNTSGDLQSGNDLTINASAQVVANDLSSTGDLQLTATSINSNSVNAGNELVITSTASTDVNNLIATNNITVSAASVNTNNVQTGNELVISTTGNTTTANINAVSSVNINGNAITTGDIQTNDTLDISAVANAFTGNINAALDININAATVNADDIQSGDVLNITTSGNTTTADMTAVANINIIASSINAANIIGGNDVTLIANSGNINTLILSAINDINVTTQEANANLLTTSINSGNDVNWQLNGAVQLTGDIAVTNDINFNCITPDCIVNSNSALQLNAQDLNTQAAIQTANNQNLTINANVQSSAGISSGNRLQINASNGDISTSGSLSANKNIELSSATDGDINVAGTITTGNNFVITGDGNYNHNRSENLSMAGDWIIDTHSLTNNDTLIATDLQNDVFRVNEFHNNGVFQSDGPLTVQVDDLLNNNGVIASLEGVIKINHSQNEGNTGTINNNGIISAINLSEQQQPENTLIINPQSVIDDYIADILAGKQRTSQDLVNDIKVANLETLSQLTAGTGELGFLQIRADVLNNNERAMISATQITMGVDAINNQGGLISATKNIAINGDALSNSNSDSIFGVITARDNIDITLNDQFDNEGVIEAIDIVIDAPIQNNNSSDLVLSGLVGENVSTASSLEATASQQWFGAVSDSDTYYQYNEAGDGASLIDSNLSQLTDTFLATSGANMGGLPIIGDDLFLAQLVTDTLRENGDIPFVTNDRNNLAQLSTLYNNTLDYMNETNLNFGQLPSARQRQTMAAPIIVFEQQTLSNGDTVFVPTVLLPNSELNTNVLAANQLNSRIIAHNELLLKSEQITNSGDLIAGNNLIIDTIDLTLTTTARNWFVNDEGEVKYHSAMISAPSLAITVSGNYVQKGGQLITDTPIIIEAENIDIAGIDIQAQNSLRIATAKLESPDVLYLLARQRLNVGSNTLLTSQTDTVLSAGQVLSVNGNVQSGRDLTMMGKQVRVGETSSNTSKSSAASLLAQGNILMQAESFIELSYADITASHASSNNINGAEEENTEVPGGGIVLVAQGGYISSQNTTLAADSELYLSASNDINSHNSALNAIDITAQAANQSFYNTKLNSAGSTTLLADNNIQLKSSVLNSQGEVNLYSQAGDITLKRSQLDSQGNTALIADAGKINNNQSQLIAQGDITQQANDITVSNSTFKNSGSDASLGATNLLAKNNLTSNKASFKTGDLNLISEEGNVTINRSNLNAKGDMTISAGNSVLLNSSHLNARTNVEKDSVINAVMPKNSQEGVQEEVQPTTSGNFIILADKGNIVNTTGKLTAQNSGYMKAGGDIINHSQQTVVQNNNQYNSARETNTIRKDYEGEDEYGSYQVVNTTDTQTKIESQGVKSSVATINTGMGGLTQITGGDISNEGGKVRSNGNLYQQAEGSIKNTTLTKRYIKNKTTIQTATTVDDSDAYFFGRNKNHVKTTRTTSVKQTDGVAVLTASTSAAGSLTQVAGKDIINTAGTLYAGGDLYQEAKGNIKNLSVDQATELSHTRNWRGRPKVVVDKRQLLTANAIAGGNMTVDAQGSYQNTGNINAGKDINIAATNIINTRLTRTQTNLQKTESKDAKRIWLASTKTITTTSGRQQVLDTGRVSAGGNVILNASNKITDTAGRYSAGTNQSLKDNDGNKINGGIYADAVNGIDMNSIKWTETDKITQGIATFEYDNYEEMDGQRVTRYEDRGYNNRDYIVTGNLNSAGHTRLKSESGDLKLAGTDIQAGQQIALQGRNITLAAVANNQKEYRKKRHKKTIESSITNDVVKLNAGEGITLTTTGAKEANQGNLTMQGAKLNAGGGELSHVVINATGDINLDAVNDEKYSYYYKKKKRSWGRSKTTINESRDVTLNETEINGGGSLLVNVNIDESGRLVGKDSGTVTLEGTNINMGQNAIIYGEDGVNVLSGIEYNFKRKETHKSGFGGFTKSGRTRIEDEQRLGHAEIVTGGDIVLLSKNNVNVVAGKLTANNITADAGFGLTEAQRAAAKSEGRANVNIIGDKEALASFDHKYDKGITFSVKDNLLSLAKETNKRDWASSETYVGSVLNAREDITLRAASDVNIIGSQLTANNNLNVDAGRDLNILSGVSTINKKHEVETTRIGISVTPTDKGFEVFAGAETVKKGTEQNQFLGQGSFAGGDENAQLSGSTLLANNINLKSGEHTTILGSDLATWALAETGSDIAANESALNSGNIIINAGGKLTTEAATNNDDLSQYEERLRVGIKLTAQENISGAGDAVKNLGKAQGANTVAGGLRALDAIQGASNAGVSGSVGYVAEAERSENNSNNTTSRATTLSASNNLTLISGGDQTHTGTLANAGNNLTIKSGGNLLIQSAQNTTSAGSRSESVKVMVGFGEGSPVSGSAAYSKSDNRSTTQQNAQFNAGNTMRLTVEGDTTLQGAVVKGTYLEANLKGDLTITSLQDTNKLRSENASITVGKSSEGSSFGVSAGKDEGDKVWVVQQSGLIGTESANVKVKGHTQLNGGIINSEAENLNFETNTLALANIQDYDDYKSVQANIGISTSQSSAASGQTGSPDPANDTQAKVNSAGFQSQSKNKEQITRATIGQGNITVNNDALTGNDSTVGLNRDTEKAQEITRDSEGGVDIYYSNSSYQTVENTFENKDNYGIVETLNPVNIIAGIGESTAIGIDQIEDAFYDGLTLNDGLDGNYDNRDDKGFIRTSDAEALGKKISAKVKATTAGWTSFTTDAGETKRVGEVTTYDERYEVILQGDKKNDQMRTDSEIVDRGNNMTDESVEGVQEVTQALTDQAGNADKDAIVYNSETLNEDAANAKGLVTENKVGINTDETDISNVHDYIATVAHENSDFEQHQNGETGEALTTLSGNETANQWVHQNFTEGRETGGNSGTSVEEWRKENKGSEVFIRNNVVVSNIQPDEVEYAFYGFEGTGLDKDKSATDNDSNVAKLFNYYMGNKFYQTGVGTNEANTTLDIIGDVTGYGGDKRILAMYSDLVKTFNGIDKDGDPLLGGPDREIDIAGFSRGGALAREFANFINEHGVPDLASVKKVTTGTGRNKKTKVVYDSYLANPGEAKTISRSTVATGAYAGIKPDGTPLTSLTYQNVVIPAEDSLLVIRSISLFDTVGSFGVPGDNDEGNKRLSIAPNAVTVRQAISLDENRVDFPLTSIIDPLNLSDSRLKEKGFEGYHTDIGGGVYENDALGNDPIFWMVTEMQEAGVPYKTPVGSDLPVGLNSLRRVKHNELLQGDKALIWQTSNFLSFGYNFLEAPRNVYYNRNVAPRIESNKIRKGFNDIEEHTMDEHVLYLNKAAQ